MGQESRGAGFWSSLPGVLTGLAALITAGAGVYALTREKAEAGPSKTEAAVNIQEPTTKADAAPDTEAGKAGEAEPEPVPEAEPDVEADAAPAPGTCKEGYVWREARPGDKVCVTPQTRSETAAENLAAESRRVPGDNICLSGYVWRLAFDNDLTCVEPASRKRAEDDNRSAADRLAG